MSYLGHLDTSATIERATASTSGMGEVSLSWAEQGTAKCHLIPARPSSIMRDFGCQLEADYEAFFPAGTDIKPQDSTGARDRLLIDSKYYTVLGVFDMSGKQKGLRAYLRRMA